MAETLLLTALNSGAISVGTAAAASGAMAALPTIGTVLSIGSAAGSILGGQQQASVYKAQAQQSQLSARQEELKGRDQADKIRRSLQATLASQNAAFSARGISLNSGTPTNLARTSMNAASSDIQTAQFGAGMSAAAERGQAAQYKISAGAAKVSGYTSAAKPLGSLINA